MSANNKVYEKITESLIAKIEETGTLPWERPWNFSTHKMPQNYKSKIPYSGINFWMYHLNEFSSPYYLTFKQVKELGGNVKRGSKGTPIVFWNKVEKKTKETNDKGEPVIRNFFLLKYYTVFNEFQIEGIDFIHPEIKENEFNPIERAENIIQAMKDCPQIEHGFTQACYIPFLDKIQMPEKEDFKSPAHYYGTLFHELAHSTGHAKRLKRDSLINNDGFGQTVYSEEELVAEFTSAFLCAHAGIQNKAMEKNSAIYLRGWVSLFREKPKMLMKAAKQAELATEYILQSVEKEEKIAA